MNTGTTAVDGAAPPSRDELRSISPNPGRAGMRFDYALHDGGEVAFDVIDMAGRRVSRFEPGQKTAGSGRMPGRRPTRVAGRCDRACTSSGCGPATTSWARGRVTLLE